MSFFLSITLWRIIQQFKKVSPRERERELFNRALDTPARGAWNSIRVARLWPGGRQRGGTRLKSPKRDPRAGSWHFHLLTPLVGGWGELQMFAGPDTMTPAALPGQTTEPFALIPLQFRLMDAANTPGARWIQRGIRWSSEKPAGGWYFKLPGINLMFYASRSRNLWSRIEIIPWTWRWSHHRKLLERNLRMFVFKISGGCISL